MMTVGTHAEEQTVRGIVSEIVRQKGERAWFSVNGEPYLRGEPFLARLSEAQLALPARVNRFCHTIEVCDSRTREGAATWLFSIAVDIVFTDREENGR